MILYIKQPGITFRFKNKIYRTPIKINIFESEKDELLKILNYKAITEYEFIESKYQQHQIREIKKIDKIGNVDNRMKNFLNIDITAPDKPKKKIIKSRVIPKISKKEYEKNHFDYHDTIENEVDINIDLSTDDILKQLLEKL